MSVDLTDFTEIEQSEDLQRVNERLQRQLRAAKDRGQNLVDAVHQGAKDAMLSLGPIRPTRAPAQDRRHRPETALWIFGDWQGAKLTTSYNSEVMRRRVLAYCDKAEKITQIQRADHPVKDCVVVFGGDMVEGLFQFPTQPFEVDATIFGQYVIVSRLMVDVVKRALATYEKVKVVMEPGNHGRVGSKRDAIPRGDNFDRMCAELARQLLAEEPRLTWPDCPEDIQRLEIGAYRALVFHGDEIGRAGYASPTTLVNWLVRQQSGAYPWTFHDGYVFHFHQNQEWSLPGNGGRLFMTGSSESDNRYASVGMASSAVPSQRLHFVDPVKGRVTAQYVVWLDEVS